MQTNRPYNVYSPRQSSQKPQPDAKMSFKKAAWLGLALFITIFGLKIDLAARANAKAAVQAETARRTAAILALDDKLHGIIDANPEIKFSIAASDTKYSKSTLINAHQSMDAASTAKLLSAALYLNMIEKGQKSPSTKLEGVKPMTALRLLIQQSDDNVWQAVNDSLGHPALQSYASGLGLETYDADNNSLSAADMNKFMSLLQNGDLLNAAHTSLLLSYMQRTNLEDFISPAVGANQLFHKVGIDNDEVNDTAIIKGTEDSVMLTIYSDGQGTYNWTQRAKIIQTITRACLQAYLN